jgi:hypothetical protein
MRRCLASVLVFLVAFIASGARAGSCTPGENPFTDVSNNDIFCSEVLWLRNANVTLGCGTGTTYCPTLNVTRAQMALFMKRLARTSTPDIVYTASGSSGDIDTGLAVCTTSTYSVPATGANIRILLHALGNVSILTDGSADMFVSIEMSTNGSLYSNLGGSFSRVVVPAGQWTTVPVVWSQTITNGSGAALVPGSTYQWRLKVQRAAFTTTGEVTDTRCQLMITVPMDATFL